MTRLQQILEEQKGRSDNRPTNNNKARNGSINGYTIANLLNCSVSTAYRKIEKNSFNAGEMILLHKNFFPQENFKKLFSEI